MTSATTNRRRTDHEHVDVYIIEHGCTCCSCRRRLERTDGVTFDGDNCYCLGCSGLEGMTFLPAGNGSVTRMAARFSGRKLRVHRRPLTAPAQRPQRIGILATANAVAQAIEQSERNAARRAAMLRLPRFSQQCRTASDTQRATPLAA